MSILASTILQETYQILGRPSQADLPYLDLLVLVKDVARGRILDLKLSTRNHTLIAGAWVTPSAREMSTSGFVGGLENFIPVKVEWRYTSEQGLDPVIMPRTVQVVSFEALGDLWGKTTTDLDTYCAFYNAFADIAFSEDATELSNRQYRIWYEDTEDITLSVLSDSVELPPIFTTLCKYEAGLVALNQIENASPDWAEKRERLRMDFAAQLSIWSQRFDQWRRNLWGNKKIRKGGAPRRFKSR